MADVHLAIIGSGLNGVSISRDAAGRGLRGALFEQNDLGSKAALASPHLLHGNFIIVDSARRRWGFLTEFHARRLVEAYGTRIENVLGQAQNMDEIGPRFGDDLIAMEIRYLMREEFARFADDGLWRRSKLGLTMPQQDRAALKAFMAAA